MFCVYYNKFDKDEVSIKKKLKKPGVKYFKYPSDQFKYHNCVNIFFFFSRLFLQVTSGQGTCIFMCHFDSLMRNRPCKPFGSWHFASYCHVCPTRCAYSFKPEWSEAHEGKVPCLRTQHRNTSWAQTHNNNIASLVERVETWYFSDIISASSGVWTTVVCVIKLHAPVSSP